MKLTTLVFAALAATASAIDADKVGELYPQCDLQTLDIGRLPRCCRPSERLELGDTPTEDPKRTEEPPIDDPKRTEEPTVDEKGGLKRLAEDIAPDCYPGSPEDDKGCPACRPEVENECTVEEFKLNPPPRCPEGMRSDEITRREDGCPKCRLEDVIITVERPVCPYDDTQVSEKVPKCKEGQPPEIDVTTGCRTCIFVHDGDIDLGGGCLEIFKLRECPPDFDLTSAEAVDERKCPVCRPPPCDLTKVPYCEENEKIYKDERTGCPSCIVKSDRPVCPLVYKPDCDAEGIDESLALAVRDDDGCTKCRLAYKDCPVPPVCGDGKRPEIMADDRCLTCVPERPTTDPSMDDDPREVLTCPYKRERCLEAPACERGEKPYFDRDQCCKSCVPIELPPCANVRCPAPTEKLPECKDDERAFDTDSCCVKCRPAEEKPEDVEKPEGQPCSPEQRKKCVANLRPCNTAAGEKPSFKPDRCCATCRMPSSQCDRTDEVATRVLTPFCGEGEKPLEVEGQCGPFCRPKPLPLDECEPACAEGHLCLRRRSDSDKKVCVPKRKVLLHFVTRATASKLARAVQAGASEDVLREIIITTAKRFCEKHDCEERFFKDANIDAIIEAIEARFATDEEHPEEREDCAWDDSNAEQKCTTEGEVCCKQGHPKKHFRCLPAVRAEDADRTKLVCRSPFLSLNVSRPLPEENAGDEKRAVLADEPDFFEEMTADDPDYETEVIAEDGVLVPGAGSSAQDTENGGEESTDADTDGGETGDDSLEDGSGAAHSVLAIATIACALLLNF